VTTLAILLVGVLWAGVGGAADPVPAQAASYTLKLDPATTRITFLLDAFLHKVHGTAALQRAEIRFDESGHAEGEIVVDARKTDTGNDGRDQDMHTKVLESAKFTEIVLAVHGFEGKFDPSAPSKITVNGTFRIHGAEHPLRLEVALKPQGDGATKKLEATTTFAVPYVEWGMKDPSKAFLRVGKEVEVQIDARGELIAGH
jgi:polyisoprenoid-binding protein YceI